MSTTTWDVLSYVFGAAAIIAMITFVVLTAPRRRQ